MLDLTRGCTLVLLKLVPLASVKRAEYEAEVEKKTRKVPITRDHPDDFFTSFNVTADADGSQAGPTLAAYSFLVRHKQRAVKLTRRQ